MAFELFDVVIAFRFGDLIDVNDFSTNLKAWFCAKLVRVWEFRKSILQQIDFIFKACYLNQDIKSCNKTSS